MTAETSTSELKKTVCNDIEVTRSRWQISMRDGARLRGFLYQLSDTPRRGRKVVERSKADLVCLPSELGNSKEFEKFALALIVLPNSPRRIFCVDLRGRGLSEMGSLDRIGAETDSDDLISLCDGLGLHHTDFIASGNSAHPLLLAAPKRPGLMRRTVFNDSGPELDGVGVAKMNALLKRTKSPQNWNDAGHQLRDAHGEQFPQFDGDTWIDIARQGWKEANGKIVPDLADGFAAKSSSFDFDRKQPQHWMPFKLLRGRPVLLVRGENSLMLTQKQSDQMREVHGDLQEHIADGQGHVPLLEREPLPEIIADFLAS